jgi:sulfur transfer protein SufE
MNLPPGASEALAQFSAAAGWEQRARLLMQWGERLAPLDAAECSETNRVQGCESVVWLVAEQHDGQWHFRAASEARLLRGLLALLLVRVEGLSSSGVRGLDLPDWFARLGLARQLSPSRANGMNAVLQRIDTLMRAT